MCFERRVSKQNSVIRLKSNIWPPPKFLGWLRHWMDCACLLCKMCGYYYCRKRSLRTVNQIESYTIFLRRQHGPAWKCIYPKNKP